MTIPSLTPLSTPPGRSADDFDTAMGTTLSEIDVMVDELNETINEMNAESGRVAASVDSAGWFSTQAAGSATAAAGSAVTVTTKAGEASASATAAAGSAAAASASATAAAGSATTASAGATTATTKASEAAASAATASAAATTTTTKADGALASAGAASTSAIAAAASAASVPGNVAASVAYLEAIASLVAGGSVDGVPAPIFAWAPWLTPELHPRAVFSRASISSFLNSIGWRRYAAANTPTYDCASLSGVCKGLLIYGSSVQDCQNSEQLDNVKWSKTRVSVTPNAITYPDGTTGDKIIEDMTANNTHAILQSRPISAGSQQCAWMVVSAAERKKGTLLLYGTTYSSGYRVTFDLDAKTIAITKMSTQASNSYYGLAELGNGLFLVWVSCIVGDVDTTCITQMLMCDTAGNTIFSGDGISGLYIKTIGSCAGSFPPPYIPTGWETTSATSGNIGTGAKTFTVGHNSTVPGRAIPAGASVRVWQTSNPANYMTGTVTSHTGTSLALNITAISGSATSSDWTIQAGASVTRAADICTVPLSSLIGSAGEALWTGVEGTLVVQAITALGNAPSPAFQLLMCLDDGTFSNRIMVCRKADGAVWCLVDVGGVHQVNISLGVVTNATEFRAAFSFKSNYFCASINGAPAVSVTSGFMPTALTTMRLGCDPTGGSPWNGTMKALQLYNRALADVTSLSMPA